MNALIDKQASRVALINPQGYFDKTPILGNTDTGGQITYVLELAKGLMRAGVDVDIFTRRFEDRKEVELVRREGGKSARIIRIPAGHNNFIAKEQLFSVIDEFVANSIAWIDQQKLCYDLFHGHYWDGGLVGIQLAEHYEAQSIWTPHSLGAWKLARMSESGMSAAEAEEDFRLEERIEVEQQIIDRSSHVVALSEKQARAYKRHAKLSEPKLITLLPGVNIRQFNTNKGLYDNLTILPENMIFSVSRIAASKRLDLLIEAFAYVVERRPGTFLLIGGGSDNPGDEEIKERRKLRRLVTKLGLRNNILFTGYISHENFLPAYYRACKVFVMSSSYEPFGLTVLEAMACGAPVVVSKYTGVSDIANGGAELSIIDPEDSREFGRAIIRLLDDEDLRSEQAKKAHKLVLSKFTWEQVAKDHVSLYTRLPT